MSTLYLVRHAQASFFEDDYDQLSERGCEQARQLGKALAARRVQFDCVITGPAKRHRDTAAWTAQAYQTAGLPFPEPMVIDELDEHGADVILRQSLDTIIGEHPHLLELAENYRRSREGDNHDRNAIQKHFQRLFEAVTKLWVADKIVVAGVEPYAQFHARVCRGLKKTTGNQPRGSHVLAFSSVGPMTVILQQSLGLEHEAALQLGWRLRNCTVNQFLFSDNRLTLDSFNSVAHLEDDIVTYR
ncbi:bifunctional RNase H/acid phosphatase [Symmachiella dynata]|uniref:histidine phosphatase family protein n=1 Tax=Symmachiella dynata TaxID=2527995 RepID=UPI00118C6C67|nr:histidine phosphatase family protein [Symmachiella dynata]QDT46097.1 bifunctional RNase H/acid phosphatase [Symmachiella dynata]